METTQDAEQAATEASTSNLIPGDSTADARPVPAIELSLAPPFSHDLFLPDDFDPDAFLLSRRHAALDDLRSDLRAYLAMLRAELVALINEDYEDFIGLGMGLRGAVERGLGKMKAPVEQVKDEVWNVKKELEELRDEVEAKLEERRKIREGKKLVRVMLDCEEAVKKLESMLGFDVRANAGSATVGRITSAGKRKVTLPDDPAFDSSTRRMERIAAEFNQVLYLMAKGTGLVFVDGLRPRIEKARAAMQRDLAAVLKETLKLGDPTKRREGLLECLRAYDTLGLVREAEEVVKKEVVLPGLAQIIRPNCLASGALSPVLPSTPAKSAAGVAFPPIPPPMAADMLPVPDDPDLAQLPLLYNKLLVFISRELGTVIEVADRRLGSSKRKGPPSPASDEDTALPTSYDMLTNSIISPLLHSLSTTLGGILFVPGNPAVFHRHYSTTSSFLDHLEGFCVSYPQVSRLRSSPDWKAFQLKWQLSVYASLRTREIVTKIEDALSEGNGDDRVAGGKAGFGYAMRATDAAHRAIWTIWQDDFFLSELVHRFWKLTLQILSRYRTWLQAVLPAYHPPSSSAAVALVASSNAPANSRSSLESARLNPPTRPGSRAGISRPSTPASEEAMEDSTLRQLSLFIGDIQKLENRGQALFKELIEPKLPRLPPAEGTPSPQDIMLTSISTISSIIPLLSSQIVNILVKRCSERLRFIRSVGSSARAARTMPTQPSYFIADILKDLRTFLEGPASPVSATMKRGWAAEVADEVASRYTGILVNIQKTEDSLRKLKKGRQGFSLFGRNPASEADAANPEDEAKVKRQMQLDVDRLAQDAEFLGVSTRDSKAFRELKSALDGDAG